MGRGGGKYLVTSTIVVFFRYTKLLKSNHCQHCYAKYKVSKVSSNERKEIVISKVLNKVSFK